MTYHIENIFPTPLYVSDVSNFYLIQQEIRDSIDSVEFKMREDWNTHYLSDITFEKNIIDELNLQYFKEEIDKHVRNYCKSILFEYKNYTLDSWISLFKPENHGHLHSHGDSDIPGCYYYKSNGKDGDIFFETPVPNMSSSHCFYENYCKRWDHTPKEGKLLLFPGWLKHGIKLNTTDEDRISISFNVNFIR